MSKYPSGSLKMMYQVYVIFCLMCFVYLCVNLYFISIKSLIYKFVSAHPNLKLFITHNGLLSTQEAIYYGIPMISMPFFLDQHFLSKKLIKQGVAVPLSYPELSEHSILQAIEEVLTNNRYIHGCILVFYQCISA